MKRAFLVLQTHVHRCISNVLFEHFDVPRHDEVLNEVPRSYSLETANLFGNKSTLEHFYKEKYRKNKKGLKGGLYKEPPGNTFRSARRVAAAVVRGVAA